MATYVDCGSRTPAWHPASATAHSSTSVSKTRTNKQITGRRLVVRHPPVDGEKETYHGSTIHEGLARHQRTLRSLAFRSRPCPRRKERMSHPLRMAHADGLSRCVRWSRQASERPTNSRALIRCVGHVATMRWVLTDCSFGPVPTQFFFIFRLRVCGQRPRAPRAFRS